MFQDRHHLLKIITPAFPAMNSTHNVSYSTKRVISEELEAAAKRFGAWAAAAAPAAASAPGAAAAGAAAKEPQQTLQAWREVLLDVLTPVDYMAMFSHFLELQVLAKSEAVRRHFILLLPLLMLLLLLTLLQLLFLLLFGIPADSARIAAAASASIAVDAAASSAAAGRVNMASIAQQQRSQQQSS